MFVALVMPITGMRPPQEVDVESDTRADTMACNYSWSYNDF